jgi:uroporphyrinogen decarboxylase
MFGRPFMGSLDRHGIVASGSLAEIEAAVQAVCQTAPEKFILGADCTLPGDINWENIKTAIAAAHAFEG